MTREGEVPAIQLIEISKQFGRDRSELVVLEDINVEVRRGEIFAVVGPSGAGKSTLSHCVNLLDPPTSGKVLVNGRDLTALSVGELRDARRSIGTVFQSSALLSRRTAAENISLPLEYLGVQRRQREERVAELLERVGLAERANHLPHQLSGGQRQRVGIARALALRPSVLLSDEATSGLDSAATESILELLKELRRDLGLTILLITHEMAVVREIADRVARLDSGKIIEQGSVADLITDPGSALGRSLMPKVPEEGPVEGQEVWHVTYNGHHVPPDWIERLSTRLGTTVNLLSASIEPVGPVRAGQASLGLRPLPPGQVLAALDELSLAGERVEAVDAASPRQRVEVAA